VVFARVRAIEITHVTRDAPVLQPEVVIFMVCGRSAGSGTCGRGAGGVASVTGEASPVGRGGAAVAAGYRGRIRPRAIGGLRVAVGAGRMATPRPTSHAALWNYRRKRRGRCGRTTPGSLPSGSRRRDASGTAWCSARGTGPRSLTATSGGRSVRSRHPASPQGPQVSRLTT
jgi:hypothetical protein